MTTPLTFRTWTAALSARGWTVLSPSHAVPVQLWLAPVTPCCTCSPGAPAWCSARYAASDLTSLLLRSACDCAEHRTAGASCPHRAGPRDAAPRRGGPGRAYDVRLDVVRGGAARRTDGGGGPRVAARPDDKDRGPVPWENTDPRCTSNERPGPGSRPGGDRSCVVAHPAAPAARVERRAPAEQVQREQVVGRGHARAAVGRRPARPRRSPRTPWPGRPVDRKRPSSRFAAVGRLTRRARGRPPGPPARPRPGTARPPARRAARPRARPAPPPSASTTGRWPGSARKSPGTTSGTAVSTAPPDRVQAAQPPSSTRTSRCPWNVSSHHARVAAIDDQSS